MRIRTIQISLADDDYDGFVQVKKKFKAKNWNDFVRMVIKRNK